LISTRLVQAIESHGDQILDRVVAQINSDPEIVTHGSFIQEYELNGLCRDLLLHLGDCLSSGSAYALADRFASLGTLCFQRRIPLHRALRGMFLLREKMLDVAQEHMISNSSVELYAEEELERRLGRFFDRLAMGLARGFEDTVREPARAIIH
jgi:hypothetical protein